MNAGQNTQLIPFNYMARITRYAIRIEDAAFVAWWSDSTVSVSLTNGKEYRLPDDTPYDPELYYGLEVK